MNSWLRIGGLLVLFLRIAMVKPPPAPAGALPQLVSSRQLTDQPPPPPPRGCSSQPSRCRSLGLHFPSHSQYAVAGAARKKKKKKKRPTAGTSMRSRETALAWAAAAPTSPQRRLGAGGRRPRPGEGKEPECCASCSARSRGLRRELPARV